MSTADVSDSNSKYSVEKHESISWYQRTLHRNFFLYFVCTTIGAHSVMTPNIVLKGFTTQSATISITGSK